MCYSLSASLAALAVGMVSAAVVATEAEARPAAYTIAWVSLVQAAEAVAHAEPSARGAVARALILLLGTQLLFLAPGAPCAAQAFAVALAVAVALTAAFAKDVPAVQLGCAASSKCRMEWPFLRMNSWLNAALCLQYAVMAVVLFIRREESPAYPAMLVAGALSLGASMAVRNSPASPWCMFAAFSFPIVAGTVLWHQNAQ